MLSPKALCWLGLSLCLTLRVDALNFDLPDNGTTVLGSLKEAKTVNGDTLSSMGRRHEVGIVELLEANPDFKIDQSFAAEQAYVVPTAFILPNAPHKGIVINLSELRLYFYIPNTREVLTFPVGVGRQDWNSPLGETYIVRKKADPTWTPTPHILESSLKLGIVLPKTVLPGPENPLGPYALYTGLPAILIHGSNDASGIGRRSSSGCIRMQPEAIESFFDLVPVKLTVTFVDEPIKTGWLGNDFYVEVHEPLDDTAATKSLLTQEKMHQLIDAATATRPATIDWSEVTKALEEKRGYPVKVGEGDGAIPQIITPVNPAALFKGKIPVPHKKTVKTVHGKKSVTAKT